MLVIVVYFAFGKILTLTLEAHMLNISVILLIRLDMHNSFNSSISRLESFQRFEFKGRSVRFQQCMKVLFANWPLLYSLYYSLIIHQ